ncbi:DUF1444 family protein [Salsuginibacillus kocurii]|uniref:DUF1444 family protein n=1 Tax=Salsuginibacillus kocurii TaxID=427078 RepID=UPI000362E81C|nr:DUF1444 family protein [Salsuginibacillus kocurii]
MEVNQLRNEMEKRLRSPERTFQFDKDNSSLRVERTHDHQGVTIDLSQLKAKYEREGEKALQEYVKHIDGTFAAMDKRTPIKGNEHLIYPVVRAASFPTEAESKEPLITEEHTAETRIYYAFDLGESYTLLDEGMLRAENVEVENIKETAKFNVRALTTTMTQDEVAGNLFYFVNTNDGYDASRILNDTLLEEMAAKAEGELALAIPHQDVLVFADIRNEQGYDVLGQLAFRFFSNGQVPITAMPMVYEAKQLRPIFIMARKKPKQ